MKIAQMLPDDDTTVVEIGAGTGAVTRATLERLPASAQLFAIENKRSFMEDLYSIDDNRCLAIQEDAFLVSACLTYLCRRPPDAIITGIPLSTVAADVRTKYVRHLRNA